MKKRLISIVLSILLLLPATACSKGDFSIQFIDVGQGDAALVCCDGHYMLIDGGDKQHGQTVYDVLHENDVDHLDLLVISHMHDDHIGGLPKALTWASSIDKTLAPVEQYDSPLFSELSQQLSINNSSITVPEIGDEYELGSATVEIIENGADQYQENDSIVLLVTYKKNKFLFTGDIDYRTESKICDKFNDDYPVDLLKVAHHGSRDSTETRFLSMLTNPDSDQYAIISVGANNRYSHPSQETLDRLDQAEWNVYTTKDNGDIKVTSDGKKISITTSK